MQYSKTCQSKASPIEFICKWSQVYSPNLHDKYVFMDQGGELYGNPDILNVFTNHHYQIHPTGTDSSHQNGPVERAHCVIGDHVCALLICANIDTKFWPYVFSHHLRINNAMAMNGQDSSRIFQATGMKEDFSGFRTSGCHTWIRPPAKRSAKFKHNIVKGIFLGFIPRTVLNILWYNCEIGKVGPANHVTFDEGMHDLPFKMLPPNQRDLERAELGDKFPAKPDEVNVADELWFYVYPFAKMISKQMQVLSSCSRPNFGLVIEPDPQYNRAYVLDVDAKSSAAKLCSSLKATPRALQLFYIVEIAGHHIFTKSEAVAALARIRNVGVLQFHITFAVEPPLSARQKRHNTNELALFDPQTKWTGNELPTNDLNRINDDFTSRNRVTITDDRAQSRVDPDTAKLSPFQDVEDIDFKDICDDNAPQLDVVTLRAIAALRSGLDFSEESIPTDVILTVINLITSQAITPAKQALGKFTCCKLKTMDTWNVWEAGERKQLNQFHNLQMFGEYMARPLEKKCCYTSVALTIPC